MKWATFTDAVPGVDVTVGHYQPRGLVSWTRAVDPYTFYVPQTTIAAKREPFEIASLLRVQLLLIKSVCTLVSKCTTGRFSDTRRFGGGAERSANFT